MKVIIKEPIKQHIYSIACTNSRCRCEFTYQDEDVHTFTSNLNCKGVETDFKIVVCPACNEPIATW